MLTAIRCFVREQLYDDIIHVLDDAFSFVRYYATGKELNFLGFGQLTVHLLVWSALL